MIRKATLTKRSCFSRFKAMATDRTKVYCSSKENPQVIKEA